MSHRWYLCVPILCLGVSSARADETSLTLQRVVELARTRAPSTVIARSRTDEARAALVGARRVATRNPMLEADVGPRWSDGTSLDVQTSFAVPLDLGGRRTKRIAVVNADIRREELEALSVQRQAIGAAVTAYYQVLHADRRAALATDRVKLAEAAEVTARQRNRAGDVAEFEVNLARGEVSRAQSGVAAAKSDQLRARGQLATVLGLPIAAADVVGELADRSMFERKVDTSVARPDLRVLAQEAELARAESKLARAERWPNLDLRITYEHERDANIVLGGIGISIPLFEHGQGDEARASARAKRAEAELQLRTGLATTHVSSARETYVAAVAAVSILEQQAVPLSVENETAAAASYRAGKIDLGTLLLIRREALDTRREHLDRLLEAALAGIELWIAGSSNL